MIAKKRTAWSFIVVVTLITCAFATQLRLVDRFNWTLRDQMALHLRQHAMPSPHVKLILIDDASVNHLSEVVGRYPWPRGIYSPILDFLRTSGAKSIYFDILFSEEENSQSSHNQFTAALKSHDNIHLVSIITDDYSIKDAGPTYLSKSTFTPPLPTYFNLISLHHSPRFRWALSSNPIDSSIQGHHLIFNSDGRYQ